MKLVRTETGDRQIIQKYGRGSFVVSGQAFSGPVIVLPDQTFTWNVSVPLGDLTVQDVSPVIEAMQALEVCLVGCGESMARPAKPVRDAFADAGISIDLMDTGAACRTYNVLAGESRAAGAALLPV